MAIPEFDPDRRGVIEADRVSWGPAGRPPIVCDVSFAVPTGQVLAVVGPNGAGKSTLLRCLYRVNRPTGGAIHIGGADLWSLDARAAARRIATVLQEQPADFSLTVRQIIALGRTPHRRGIFGDAGGDGAIVDAALAQLDLADLADRDLNTLSGGERQRVMIARALAQSPDVMVLDEPTNHLDIRHQLEVLTLMRSLGPTVVCSLHDLNLAAAFADLVLVLARGRVLDFGPPAAVLTERRIAEAFAVGTEIDTVKATGATRFSFHLTDACREAAQ